MKPNLLLTLALISLTTNAQWKWSNPHPSGYLNNAIVFADTQNGFVINYNGDLIRTTNQGVSWYIQQNFPTGITIDYKDSTAVVGGGGLVYVSTDGGQTWIQRIPSSSLNFPFSIVNIISRDTIFIASKSQSLGTSTVWKSIDRGNTWQQQPNAVQNISSLSMTSSKIGYATTPSGVFKTIDGWQTYQEVTPYAALFNYVKFRNKDTGFVYSPQSYKVSRTTDGGIHWSLPATIGGTDVVSFAFSDANSIVGVGDAGGIYRSVDDAVSWMYQPSSLIYQLPLFSVGFATPSVGFAMGLGGVILKTMDAGQTWSKYVPVYTDVNIVHFATDSIGYMGTWNTVYKTSDAGSNWTELILAAPAGTDRFKYIHFFGKDTGVAICDAPVRVYKTYNGGVNWQIMNLNSQYNDDILGAYTVNRTIYLSIRGLGFKILKSPDAGESWVVQNTTSGFGAISYNDPVFTDEQTGYALNGYTVYKTIDSAKTWYQLQLIQLQSLRSLSFPDKLTGYVVGDQSYILKTVDSGHTWMQLHIDPDNANIPGNLKQVKFFNYKTGFVISGTSVYRTVTGGNSWQLLDLAAESLNGIELSPDSTLFVYGINGEVLKRGIRDWSVDLFKVDSIRSCNVKVSARITSVLTTVDSVWFQYGTSSYQNQILVSATPVTDTTTILSALLTGLNPSGTYKARVKIYYQGNYYYRDSISFVTTSQPAPSITISNGILFSSASQNNQWYLNNALIPGATQSMYTPVQSGSYTVRTIIAGCESPMSAPVTFVVTALADPLLLEQVSIVPNPVTTTLYVRNEQLKKLQITILNTYGSTILSFSTSKKENKISLQSTPSGLYIVRVIEKTSGKRFAKVIIKM